MMSGAKSSSEKRWAILWLTAVGSAPVLCRPKIISELRMRGPRFDRIFRGRRTMSNEDKSAISRRKFLGSTAAVAAATAAGGQLLFPKELSAVPAPAKWDKEADVVAVGTGYSGLAAAIEAFDAGSSVMVVEKNPFIGGNSIIASGAINAADPERQKKQGIEDSVDLHYRQTLAGGDYRGDPEKVRYVVENALESVQWLEKMGVEFEPTVYAVVGALYPRSHDPVKGGRGAAIVKVLKAQVDKRKIPVLLGYKLSGIVREQVLAGAVQGVVVENRGHKLYLKARRAVVLATGGFGADVPMRSKYDPRLDADLPTTNVASATGEAIIAAEDEGADVIGMDYIQVLIACNYYTKKYGGIVNLGIDHCVFVNTKGERFVAEDGRRDVMAEAVLAQPKKVLFWVTDERCKKRFDDATTAEILKAGLSFQADTLEGLAKILQAKFDVPPDKFLETIRKYNEYAKKGEDKDFRKQAENLKTIEKPPFYASPTQAGVHHTMGGIRTKGTTGQVIDRHGNIIPRLYAAGEVTGGVHGTNRLGGNATTDCIVNGRACGKNAAAEKLWG
jgi:flavocytochrome c